MSDIVPQLGLGNNVVVHATAPLYNTIDFLLGRSYGSAHTYMERVEGRKVARAKLLNVSVPQWRKELEQLEAQQPAITERVKALHAELKAIAESTDLSRYKRTGEPDRVSAYTSFLSPGINAYRAAVAAGRPVDDIPEEVRLAAELADLKKAARGAMGKKGQGQVPQEIGVKMSQLHQRLDVMSASIDLTRYMRSVVNDPVEALLESATAGIGAYRKSTDALRTTSFPAAVVKGVEFVDLRREAERLIRAIEKTEEHIKSAYKDDIDMPSFGEPLFDAEVAFGLSCRLFPAVFLDMPSHTIIALSSMGVGSNGLEAMRDSKANRHNAIKDTANRTLALIVYGESALPEVTAHVKARIGARYTDAVSAVLVALEKKGVTKASIRSAGEGIWEQTKSEKSLNRSARRVAESEPSHMFG